MSSESSSARIISSSLSMVVRWPQWQPLTVTEERLCQAETLPDVLRASHSGLAFLSGGWDVLCSGRAGGMNAVKERQTDRAQG